MSCLHIWLIFSLQKCEHRVLWNIYNSKKKKKKILIFQKQTKSKTTQWRVSNITSLTRGLVKLQMAERSPRSFWLNRPRRASQVVLVVKNPPVSAGDTGDYSSIPGSGRSPGEGKATHYSILAWKIPRREEPGGRRAWWVTVYGETKSRTGLSNWPHRSGQAPEFVGPMWCWFGATSLRIRVWTLEWWV